MFWRKLRLNVLQVEVSTRCQLGCVMCPRSSFRKEWVSGDMDLEIFKKLPFEKFRYVHLQGWGEPLLNPNIAEMVGIVRKHGCEVGITTNGILLSEYLDIVSKLDLVAISIAGVGEHKKIRGCKLDDLLHSMELLAAMKKSNKPKIVVVTIMLRDTIFSLPEIVEIAKKHGADEVIANNLDYIPNESLIGREVFAERDNPIYNSIVKQTTVLAKRIGIKFIARPIRLEEVLVCAENPLKNCVITVEGKVSPCVYLHLPTNSENIVRYFKQRRVEVPKIYFGDTDNFKKVWKSRNYLNFRSIFEKRLSALYDGMIFDFPELPEVCKTCYKAYSI